MEPALQWISTNTVHISQTQFILPSPSALATNLYVRHSLHATFTTSICQSISSISSTVFIQWVPGHSNFPGNDLIDRAAKEAITIKSDTLHPIPISSAFKVINKLFSDDPLSHVWTSKIYQHCKTLIDLLQQLQSWRDDVLIARLHSGHHLSLKAHHHQIDSEIDPTCPSCQQADHTLQQWLMECPAGGAIRQWVFGNHQRSLKWLTTRPGEVLAFSRKTLVDLDA